MSWYVISQLPKAIRDSIRWECGCVPGTGDEGDALVWFCAYHEGAYDFCDEGRG